jgi:hypothetical protein
MDETPQDSDLADTVVEDDKYFIVRVHKKVAAALLLLVIFLAVGTALAYQGYLSQRQDSPIPQTPTATPTSSNPTTSPMTTATPSQSPAEECVRDADCGVLNCVQAPCPTLRCVNNRCVQTQPQSKPVCGDGKCEEIEKHCRSTHPASMDCGPYYCEDDCFRR